MFSEHQSGLWGMVESVHSEPFKGLAVWDFRARMPRSWVSDGWVSSRRWAGWGGAGQCSPLVGEGLLGPQLLFSPYPALRGWGLSSRTGGTLEGEGDSRRQVYFLGDPQPVPPTLTFPGLGLSWWLLLAHLEGAWRPPLMAPGAQPRGEGLQEGSELVGGAEGTEDCVPVPGDVRPVGDAAEEAGPEKGLQNRGWWASLDTGHRGWGLQEPVPCCLCRATWWQVLGAPGRCCPRSTPRPFASRPRSLPTYPTSPLAEGLQGGSRGSATSHWVLLPQGPGGFYEAH